MSPAATSAPTAPRACGPRAGPPTPPRPCSTPRPGCWRRAGTAPARRCRWRRWPPWPTPTSPGRGYGLSLDQALAVEKVATSGRALDVLVGPAGTGKSTTMAGLRAAWEAEHGPGSVRRPRPLGGRGRGAGPGARHRHREHGQVAHRMAPGTRTGGPPGSCWPSASNITPDPRRPVRNSCAWRWPPSTTTSPPGCCGRANWWSSTRPAWPGRSAWTSW